MYRLVNEPIRAVGYPTSSTFYPYAHRKANEDERAAFPFTYSALNRWIAINVPKGCLAATHTKETGFPTIWAHVPAQYYGELEYHEKREHQWINYAMHGFKPRKVGGHNILFPNIGRLF